MIQNIFNRYYLEFPFRLKKKHYIIVSNKCSCLNVCFFFPSKLFIVILSIFSLRFSFSTRGANVFNDCICTIPASYTCVQCSLCSLSLPYYIWDPIRDQRWFMLFFKRNWTFSPRCSAVKYTQCFCAFRKLMKIII